MSAHDLETFFEKEFRDSSEKGQMVSLHLKATMMKISDPIMFGIAVKTYYKAVFDRYQADFDALGINVNNGVADVYKKIKNSPKREEIEAAL